MPLLRSKLSDLVLGLDPILNKPYWDAKLARFTSSEWSNLMSESSIDKAGLNYIYKKVGEKMTGMSSSKDFSSEATEHGLDYERDGLVAFSEWAFSTGEATKDIDMKTQRLIIDGERCGGTPDGLWVNSEREDSLTVRTVEVKCPFSFDGYIRLFKCNTPADVKKITREGVKYYWQVLHQMAMCESLIGYLVAYQPHFSSGKIKVIKFDTQDNLIRQEIKKVNERKEQAITIFNDTIKELTQ